MEKLSPQKRIGVGETVYLVESCRRVREAVVRGWSGALYTVRFTDATGGIRVRRDRLHLTRAEAEASLRQRKEQRQPSQSPPIGWHNVPLWQC